MNGLVKRFNGSLPEQFLRVTMHEEFHDNVDVL